MKPASLAKMIAIAALGVLAVLSEGWQFAAPLHHLLCLAAVDATDFILRTIGLPTYVDGMDIHGPGYSVSIVPACNGLVAFTVLLSGIALVSLPSITRALLALIALPAVFLANVARITTTLTIGTRSEEAARIAHETVFPLVIVLVFAALWYQWLAREAAATRPQVRSTQ